MIEQLKDAVHDGLRAVKNALEDRALVPGAGAFEVAAHLHLLKYRDSVQGHFDYFLSYGFSDILPLFQDAPNWEFSFCLRFVVIPKTLAANSWPRRARCNSYTPCMESWFLPRLFLLFCICFQDEARKGSIVGLNVSNGQALVPAQVGIWDNYCVKRQFLHLGSVFSFSFSVFLLDDFKIM